MRSATKYNPRILTPYSPDDLAAEIELVGAHEAGIHRMLPKSQHYVMKLHAVTSAVAHVLKESFLASGGDAAISRKMMTDRTEETTDAILIGSRKHFSNAARAISHEEIGGPELASEIEGAIAVYESGPLVPPPDVPMDPDVRWMLDSLLERTLIMGILNITPDSFSDGGKFLKPQIAVRQAMQMIEDGADIIDIGGESTRPGSEPVSAKEEMRRIIPVIKELSDNIDRPISVDTYKAETALAAIEAGAAIINDISGMSFDPDMRHVAAEKKCPIILTHIKGEPRNMQQNPTYTDVMGDIHAYLRERIADAVEAGVDQHMIIVDPGIGFGKTVEHNLTILRRLRELQGIGRPVLVGVSRKATIGHLLDGAPPEERIEGTAAAVTLSIAGGAHIVRVHDVKEMARVAKVTDAIVRHG